MKKIILVTSILLLSICSVFAASSDITFANFGNVQVFNRKGQPVNTSVLNSGNLIIVSKSRTVLKLEDNRVILVEPESVVSIMNDDLIDMQLYLLTGSLSIQGSDNGKLTVFTAVSKYWADEKSEFVMISNNTEETTTVTEGKVYTIYSGDNSFRVITKGQTYSLFSNEIEPQTPKQDYNKQVPKEDVKTNEIEIEPIQPIIKEQPKEEVKEQPKEEIKEQPKEEIKEQPKEEVKEQPKEEVKEQPKEEVKEQPKEEIKEQPKEEIKEQPKEEIKEQPKEEVKEQPKEEVKEQPKEEVKEQNNSPVSYTRNAFDFGLKAVGMTTIDGTQDYKLSALNFGVNPYFEFANSRLEFRLLWHTNIDDNNKILHPWNNLSFENASEALKSIGNFIHDIKIEDFLIISRQREIPLSISSLNLKNRQYNLNKLPLYANIDLTYLKINAYVENLFEIKTENVLKSASLSIIPSQTYRAALTLNAIHNPAAFKSETLTEPEFLFTGDLKLPIVSIFSIGVHGGLPFLYKNDARKLPKSFFAGLDFNLEIGGFRLLFGADYSQKRVFTNYMNMTNNSIWSLYNLGTKDIEGLNAITPYVALDFRSNIFGVGLNAAYPFYLGSARPWDDGSAYSSWKYNLDARFNIFVEPFANKILRIGAEWNTYNLFKNGFKDDPSAPLSSFALDWFPTFVVTSEHGPIFMRGQFDLKRATNASPLRPVLNLLMSVKIGSDYVFNPAYIAYRREKENISKNIGRLILRLDVQDNILFAKNAAGEINLGSQIVLQPIFGYEHPLFAIIAKYKFTNFDFSEWNTCKEWGVGKWIDTFLYKLNLFNILKVEGGKTFALKDNTNPIYKQSILPTLTLDFDLFKILTIQVPYVSTNLDNIIKDKIFNGVNASFGYRSELVNAYITSVFSGNWNDPNKLVVSKVNLFDAYLALNVDFNIKGWRGGVFFGTTVTQTLDNTGKLRTLFGLTKGGWGEDQNDMLVGGMFGYKNNLFHAELTGGAQLNRATYKYNDSLTRPTIFTGTGDPIENYYKVTDKDGNIVKGKFVPFFNVSLGINTSNVFIFNLDYTLNISPKFNELYRDRLSAQLKVITPIIDINGVIEKRGVLTGGSLRDLWTENAEITEGTELAYKLGIDIKTDLAIFTIEYENRFFGKTLKDAAGDTYDASCLILKTSIGLL